MIPPGRGNRRIRFLAAVFILLLAAVSLYGRGAKEDATLSRADELITQKEYDQAIQILSDYLKDNPDQFGEAQKKLQKIVQIRERYNQVANELLDTVETDPDNNEKILELSNLLLTIESPSNPTTKRFLDQIRFLAEFNVNRKRLERIFGDARVQLAENNYSGALNTYASGLDIYQDLYFSSGYGQEAEDVASRGLETINENIQRFNALTGPFSRAAQAMTNYYSASHPDPAGVTTIYAALLPQMDVVKTLWQGFYDTRKAYDAQLAKLQQEQDVIGDRSFLSFAGRLITGPAGQNEGMTGTLDRFWRFWLEPTMTALSNCVDDSYGSGLAALINWDYTGGLSVLDETTQYIATALELVRSWNSFLVASDTQNYSIYGELISEEMAGNFLKFETMDRSLVYLKQAGNIGTRANEPERGSVSVLSAWQQGAMDAETAISREQIARTTYENLMGELSTLERAMGPEIDTVRSYQNSLADVPGSGGTPLTYLTDTRNLVVNLNYRFQALRYDSIVRMYTIADGDLGKRVNAREKEFNEGNGLIQGVSQDSEEGVYTAYYPTEGLAILTQMNQTLVTDITAARALLSRYTAEPRDVLDAAEVNAFYVSAQDYLTRLLNLQNRSTGLMASARTQIDRAASLRVEGDRLFQAAQAALNRNDINGAKNNLNRASEQYDASLAIQESDSLKAIRDTQLVNFGAEIVRVENEAVVRDVRNLVTSARNYYFAGNMEQAETDLVNAQNRWRVTNITEQPEVEYWLGLVRGAMSIQSGRTIPVTAPLYAEMSQLLSDASRNFNDGVRLLNGGQRQDGLSKFNDAMEKTREIRLMFPLNHDARMLELRIEQQTDQSAFNASFRQRISEAVAGTKTRDAQSFADLQDLAEINPGYPGIKNILSQAEIDMGLRPPPIDPKDLASSTELSRNAQTVINARDSIRYEAAETWLSDAIKLNPNNTQAQTLLDQLNILMYGTGTIVLPSYATEQYNTALQQYLRGNYLLANSIVEQLLQNPEYRKSIQIQDLKRRIDAVQ